MPKPRLTFNVAETVTKLNAHIERAPTKEIRQGIAHCIETILHDAHAYGGYSYTPKANVQNPGLVNVTIGDDSYRCYSVKRSYAKVK